MINWKIDTKKAIKMAAMIMITAGLLAGCGSSGAKDSNQKDDGKTVKTTTNSDDMNTTAANPEITGGSGNNASGEPVELMISAAASLTDVTAEIAQLYEQRVPNVKLTFSYGSSGALQTQIEEGAPADLFLSAAQKQMDALQEKGLVAADSRIDLLENKVVLIVPKDSTLELSRFEDLGKNLVKTVAIGDPASVPVGQYSESLLTKMGIYDKVKAKANFGTDVRQVLTWVESGEIDCGIVYTTDAIISDQVEIVCEAPEDQADRVIYPAAVLTGSKHPDDAKAFLEYMKTDEMMQLFEKYGFTRVK